MSEDTFGGSSLRGQPKTKPEAVPDDETDDGLDVDALFDAIGDRDWETMKTLLEESGHTLADVGEIIESVIEDEDDV